MQNPSPRTYVTGSLRDYRHRYLPPFPPPFLPIEQILLGYVDLPPSFNETMIRLDKNAFSPFLIGLVLVLREYVVWKGMKERKKLGW